ncbi:MAG: hypothetical protein JSR48_11295 [Verrucomicrobia bacterium]|nr:hypothetical protein [Verrucomicrobiota bacterium]
MSEAATHSDPALEAPWRASLRAARANVVPGVVLWSVGLVLVLAYYFHPPTHAALERVTGLRDRIGFWFPIIGTVICGGILPILYLRRDPATRDEYRLKNCGFLILFWAYKGVEIELWYRFLAFLVGHGNDLRTVMIKSLLDQVVYCPIYAVPMTVLGLSFNHAGLRFAPLLADFRAGGWYRRHILPTLIANAAIWVPVVFLVYSLPLSLQTLLFDLVLCFYILMVAHITRRHGRRVS